MRVRVCFHFQFTLNFGSVHHGYNVGKKRYIFNINKIQKKKKDDTNQ